MNGRRRNVRVTESQAAEEIERLERIFPTVKLLNEDEVESDTNCLVCGAETPCMRKVCEGVLESKEEQTRVLRLGNENYKATARYLEVDGEPRVLVCSLPLDMGANDFDEDVLYRDSLSGAYNRRFYDDRLKREHIFAGVALIDLDDFKMVNDTLGHHAGDLALKAAVQIMFDSIRETDILVRYGGDEFVLVMPNVEREVFDRRLRMLSETMSKTSVPGCDQAFLSTSIGGVISNGVSIEEAVKQADKLMYRAKHSKSSVLTDADDIDAAAFQRPLLLIIDDSEMNREILKEMLKEKYEIIEADGGRRGIEEINAHGNEISLVLLDIIMPDVNGFEVLFSMSRNKQIEDIPVIMISSEDSDDSVLRAYELGASDYIGRPFDARIVQQRVENIMRLYARQRRLSALLAQQFYEREKSSNVLVNIMGGAMELRNGESGPHVLHVRNLTEILLDRLLQKTNRYSITSLERSLIIMTSTLHDIGKLAIPDNILNKPGRLTDEEFEIMKSHTTLGSDMLDKLNMYSENELLLNTAHDICRWHHERYDGNGYPDGLKGDQIPISAQVVALADVYDALTSDRVYKKAIPHKEAIRMIVNGECGVFNPLLIECLLEVQTRVEQEINEPIIAPPPTIQ